LGEAHRTITTLGTSPRTSNRRVIGRRESKKRLSIEGVRIVNAWIELESGVGHVRDVRTVPHNRDFGRDGRRVEDLRRTRRSFALRDLVARRAAAPQHRQDDRLGQTLPLQRDHLVRIDAEDGVVALDHGEDHPLGHPSFRHRDDFVDRDR